MPGLRGRKEAEVWGRGCPELPALPQGTEPSSLEVLPQHLGSHKKGRYREEDPRLLGTKAWPVGGFSLKSSPLVRNKENRMQRWKGRFPDIITKSAPQPAVRTP